MVRCKRRWTSARYMDRTLLLSGQNPDLPTKAVMKYFAWLSMLHALAIELGKNSSRNGDGIANSYCESSPAPWLCLWLPIQVPLLIQAL